LFVFPQFSSLSRGVSIWPLANIIKILLKQFWSIVAVVD